MAVTAFEAAPAVAAIAHDLIDAYHPHLDGIPIIYVFRSPAQMNRGDVVLGKARKVSGLNAFLCALAAGESDPEGRGFFVMDIALDWWTDRLEDEQRWALVDHELCHMKVNMLGELVVVGHDVEEFTRVVRRHGLWTPTLDVFGAVCATSTGVTR